MKDNKSKFDINAVKLDNRKNLRFRDIDGKRNVISISQVRTLIAVPYDKNDTVGTYTVGATKPYKLYIHDRGLKYELIYRANDNDNTIILSESTFNQIIAILYSDLKIAE